MDSFVLSRPASYLRFITPASNSCTLASFGKMSGAVEGVKKHVAVGGFAKEEAGGAQCAGFQVVEERVASIVIEQVRREEV